MKLADFNLTNIEEISDSHYFKIMTFGEYIELVKDHINCENKIIINAELEATYLNSNMENSSYCVKPLNVFITENEFIVYNNFQTLVILNLDERFMNNKVFVNIYAYNLEDTRKMIIQFNAIKEYE